MGGTADPVGYEVAFKVGWQARAPGVDPIEARRSAVGLKPFPDDGLGIFSQNDSVERVGMAWPILLQGEARAMLRPVTSD